MADVKQALKIGAISENEFAVAITDVKLAFIQKINALQPGRDALASIGEQAKRATIDMRALERAMQSSVADQNIGGKPLDDIRAKYNPLFAAQRQYRQELADVREALKIGAISQSEYAAAITNTKVSFVQQVNALRPGRDALAETASAAGRTRANFNGLSFEARNLGYQLVDVTQGALMGQSAFQIFAQQGGQVAQVIATSPGGLGGLLKELGRSFAGILTPMRLLGTAAVVTGVAAYAMNAVWKSSALQFDDTSRAIGTTIGQLRGLERAAAVKGIEDFAKDAEKFAGSIYQARNNMGGLADVFRVNGERATDFKGTLESAARIIQRATSDQQRLQLLQQMGLPATMQWVRFLSQGEDAVRRAANESNGLVAKEQELIDKARQFDEAWSATWLSFKSGAFSAYLSTKGWLTDLATYSASWRTYFNPTDANARTELTFGSLGNFQNKSLQDALNRRASQLRGDKPAVDPQAAQRALSLEQQRISLLGQTASVGQQVRLVEVQIAQARMNGVSISAREADSLKEIARQRALGIDTIRAQTDAYRIDAATVGMSIEQAAAYAAVQQRLNEARRNGQVLTAAQVAEIEREGAALGRAAGQADELRFRYDTFSGVFREFGQNLRNGQSAWEAFRNAGVNALGKIADRLMDMASRQLWNAAFPMGGGGIFGSLFGGGSSGPALGGGIWPAANGNVFAAPGLSAYSGSIVTRPTMFPVNDGPIAVRAFAKGAGLMGEAGPEAVMPLTRTSDGKLGVRASAGSGQGVVIQQSNYYTFTGVEPGMEARLKRYIDAGDRKARDAAVAAVPVQKRNSPTTYLAGTR